MSVEQKQQVSDEAPVDRIEDGHPEKIGDQLMSIAEDVIDSHPSGTSMYMMRLYAILSVGYFCIILQGYDSSLMGAINAVPEYLAYFGMKQASSGTGLVFAMYNIGCVTALPFAGPVNDRFGRRWGMFTGAFLVIAATCIMAPATNMSMFLAGRWMVGFGQGFLNVAGITYVTEMAHPYFRGPAGAFLQTNYFVGSMIASWVTYGTAFLSGDITWRLPTWLQMASSVYICIGIFFIPDTPRWLMARDRQEEAEAVLVKFHGEGSRENPWVKLHIDFRSSTPADGLQTLGDGDREAPGIFFQDGIYFMILSAKTGYRPNPNKVYWATSLEGPWQGGSDIAPPEVNTYNSQNSFELTIKGTEQTTHIYVGDDWVIGGWADSKYVWLPINADAEAKTAPLEYHDMWKVNVETGVVSFPTTKKRYPSEHNTLSKRSGITEVTFSGVLGTGALQWFRFNYKTDNPQRKADLVLSTCFQTILIRPTDAGVYVIVNNELVANITDLNSRAGHGSSTPIQLKLNPGEDNTVTLGALGQDTVIEMDDLEIFEDDFAEL